MLAVKFHHLRALIYRSFLCLPLLQMNNKPFMDLLLQDKQRISKAEWICISEAQQTAHLLHNVVDERSLVHDFPWWQMIPCLICASSILSVAETFHSSDWSEGNSVEGRPSAQSLREDAETCLKVFEALSVNSTAARKAANMLGSLSQVRLLAASMYNVCRCPVSFLAVRSCSYHLTETPDCMPSSPAARPEPSSTSGSHSLAPPATLECPQITPQPGLLSHISAFDWPSEISSSMEWSARFLDYPNLESVYDSNYENDAFL